MDDDPTAAPIRYHDRMSDEDALMWSIEKDPMLRSTITTVILLERPIDRETLRRTFERLTRVVPRLRQRVRSNLMSLAPPRWEIDPNLDLDYHLRAARVPGDGSLRDLLRMTQPIAMQGFDRARPQWECTAVDGLADGRDALILKFHHAMTDGVGGVRLMLELFDLTPDAPERAMPPAPPVHVLNQTERFTDALGHQARTQVGLLRELTGAGTHVATSAIRHLDITRIWSSDDRQDRDQVRCYRAETLVACTRARHQIAAYEGLLLAIAPTQLPRAQEHR